MTDLEIPALAASIASSLPRKADNRFQLKRWPECFDGFGSAGPPRFWIDPVVSRRERLDGYQLHECNLIGVEGDLLRNLDKLNERVPVKSDREGDLFPNHEAAMHAAKLRRRELAKALKAQEAPRP